MFWCLSVCFSVFSLHLSDSLLVRRHVRHVFLVKVFFSVIAELSWVEMGWRWQTLLSKKTFGWDGRTNERTDRHHIIEDSNNTQIQSLSPSLSLSPLSLPLFLSFSPSDYDLAFLYFSSLFYIQFLAVSQTSISLFLFFFSLSNSVSDFFNLSSQTFYIK